MTRLVERYRGRAGKARRAEATCPIFRDPRAKEQDNEDYIDLMESYFEKASKDFYAGKKLDEAKPEYHY